MPAHSADYRPALACVGAPCNAFAPNEERREAWALIARHVDAGKLEAMTGEIGLSEVIGFCPSVLEGKVRGRTVVDVSR